MAQKILICSGKGGAGKTTTTVGLMRALTQKGKKVLLMDCDIGLRSLDIFLDVQDSVYTWQDVIEETATVDDALLYTETEKNAALLLPPRSLETLPSKEDFKILFSKVDKDFDYIFMDAPAGLFGIVPILAEFSDEAILIATPDRVSARAAATIGEMLYDALPKLPQRLILNRFDYDRVKMGYSLCADAMVDETLTQLLGAVPEAECLVALSKSGKVDPKVASAYDRIAERMLGNAVPFQEKKTKFVGI